jgi:hypothetical protein
VRDGVRAAGPADPGNTDTVVTAEHLAFIILTVRPVRFDQQKHI